MAAFEDILQAFASHGGSGMLDLARCAAVCKESRRHMAAQASAWCDDVYEKEAKPLFGWVQKMDKQARSKDEVMAVFVRPQKLSTTIVDAIVERKHKMSNTALWALLPCVDHASFADTTRLFRDMTAYVNNKYNKRSLRITYTLASWYVDNYEWCQQNPGKFGLARHQRCTDDVVRAVRWVVRFFEELYYNPAANLLPPVPELEAEMQTYRKFFANFVEKYAKALPAPEHYTAEDGTKFFVGYVTNDASTLKVCCVGPMGGVYNIDGGKKRYYPAHRVIKV